MRSGCRRGDAVALVQPVGAAPAAAVGDHDGDVGERVAQQVGEVVEGVAHELFEVLVVERVELEELDFVGVRREPFAREPLGAQHDLVELGLGLGVAPAPQAHRDERDARRAAAPTTIPDRDVLERAHGADRLKPCPTTITTRPSDIATSAARPTRRKLTGGALSWGNDRRTADPPYLACGRSRAAGSRSCPRRSG